MPRCSEHRRSRLPTAHLDQHDQPRRPVCAAGQPAGPQASQGCGLSMRAREFPALTGRPGTHRACRRSLGYEQCDVRLPPAGRSLADAATSAEQNEHGALVLLRFPCLTPFRVVRFTNLFTCSCAGRRPPGDNGGVTDFGGPGPFTTWDGEPVSREPPHGATVVVAARAPGGWRCLLLHRGHHGPSWDGDWAWTPPTGSRKPGEDVTACAVRELGEETGLDATPRPVVTDEVEWAVFGLARVSDDHGAE